MKNNVKKLIRQALKEWSQQANLDVAIPAEIYLERTKNQAHGDFASNIAMTLAKPLRQAPRVIAENIVAHWPDTGLVDKVEVAGPGFINFFLTTKVQSEIVMTILSQGSAYGCSDLGRGRRVNIEFVSANPTGPLHVGHGRGAAYGAALAAVLRAAGLSLIHI